MHERPARHRLLQRLRVSGLRWFSAAAGVVLLFITFMSLTKTLISPRAFGTRLARAVEKVSRSAFLTIAGRFDDFARKDRVLVLHGPVAGMLSLMLWLFSLVLSFGLILWPFSEEGFFYALRESGSSIFTLGFASDPEPLPTAIMFIAAFCGLIVIALMIAYLPALYASFNRRATHVTVLQSRAGSPAWGPEILARHQLVRLTDRLTDLYRDWEIWAADVAESHTNYPILIYFRSPHPLRSWVLGLLAVMDAAALHLALCPASAPSQARLCIRMGFTALRDIASATGVPFDPDPLPDEPIELTYEEFLGAIHRLEEAGFDMEVSPEEAWPNFRGWRVNYEGVAYALADRIVAPPGPWSGRRTHLPDMNIVPKRPADRRPDRTLADRHPKGTGVGL